MSLSPEFESFYRNWLAKADSYQGQDLRHLFDKFFTLFVLFNRLYAEATFVLARSGQINLSRRTSFPDADAAKSYVAKYIGTRHLMEVLTNDSDSARAIDTVSDLIREKEFHIKLDMVTGNLLPHKDQELLQDLQSRSYDKRARAILDALYCIRCNMFHAHKGFNKVQERLLNPMICILRRVVEVLHQKLNA